MPLRLTRRPDCRRHLTRLPTSLFDQADPRFRNLETHRDNTCASSFGADRRGLHFQSSLHQNSLPADQPADNLPATPSSLSGSTLPRIGPPAFPNRAPIHDECPTSCCKNFLADSRFKESLVAINAVLSARRPCSPHSRHKMCLNQRLTPSDRHICANNAVPLPRPVIPSEG